MPPEAAAYDLWLIWVLSWMAAAFWASKAKARPDVRSQWVYHLIRLVGAILLFVISSPELLYGWQWSSRYFGPFGKPLWTLPDVAGWLFVAIMLAGFALCWWARVHLGRLWSGLVTTKVGHRVVNTGPYRLVRHPIYTGILLASLALAVIKGTPVAVIGFALLLWSFLMKARLEEKFLGQQLGPAAYLDYQKRTPMLLPFWPVRR